MLIESFVRNDNNAISEEIRPFLSSLNTRHRFDWATGSRDLPTGVPSHFLDIFPQGVVDKYDSFGIVYIRLWLVGRNPTRLLAGVFLGAARAEQAEPRRAASYVRGRLANLLTPLEQHRGYQYKTWGDNDIWWRDHGMSVRAVTRQFEQFITYRSFDIEDSNLDTIQDDVRELVRLVDRAIEQLEPIREFGQQILLIYYGENLPPAPDEGAGILHNRMAQATIPPVSNDWFRALPSSPDLGDLKGLDSAYQKLAAALASGKHALLFGPPGVGKTELAEAMCRLIRQPYLVATATSDWTSMHTIGGYMPMPQPGGTVEQLDFVPGLFTEAIDKGTWLIIDEMNRADIDKAFGEMFTLLGGKQKSISLPYKKRQQDGSYMNVVLGQQSADEGQHLFELEPSWRFIGTMNTFDKASLFQMSFAFSRRVAVIEIDIPDESTYKSILSTGASVFDEGQAAGLYEDVLAYLVEIFASHNSGLMRINLPVGPAIPLDIIRFIDRMRRFENNASSLVLMGLEMYLYPQFEGRHEQTEEIASVVATALGFSELPAQSLRKLQTFTGSNQ